MSAMARFLGDSPWRVVVKLVVVSFLVGIVMAAFGWTPWDLVDRLRDAAYLVWYRGFSTLESFFDYMLLGAAVVIPIFLILRLLSLRR